MRIILYFVPQLYFTYSTEFNLKLFLSLGFNYEFNSLTSQNELAEAYETILKQMTSGISAIISILSNYISFIRKLPLNINNKFNDSIKVIERVSKELVEERKYEVKNNKSNKKMYYLYY